MEQLTLHSQTPQPQRVRYNDWRQVAAPALGGNELGGSTTTPGAFTPALPVSVIVPYYAQPEELARTLAALEGQTYPREFFEVVVVDDGSPEPLTRPRRTPLDLKVVRQENRGFGLARARNRGAHAAAHDVLLFLDADMLPQAGWLAAHARWHHAVPDAVTQGFRAHVAVDRVNAGMIRNWPGTLKELFASRVVNSDERHWFEGILRATNNLTTDADDLFRIVLGCNLGVRREFYELVGGYDESFTQWGGEDTEFGYRACVRGGLLVPVPEAFAWHQGLPDEGRAEKDRSLELQRAKLAHLIAHHHFRTGQTGRIFTVPQYVVTIEGEEWPANRLLQVVERVLSGSIHDLVVRLELPADYPDREWLERQLGADPRVRLAPPHTALAEFPASPFHVTLPAGRLLHLEVVRRLHAKLGTAVIAQSTFFDGTRASITRAWALHRALRTPWEAAEFGEVVTVSPGKLTLRRAAWAHMLGMLRQVNSPVAARQFARWLVGAILQRVLRRSRAAPPRAAPSMPAEAPPPPSDYPLAVEIAALGARSQAVFAASRRVARTAADERLELVVADTTAEATGVATPTVVLVESPPMLSTPAFEPRTNNPIGWRRDVGSEVVGALGPLELLPPGCGASRVVRRDDQAALRELHHLEDVAAFHADVLTRAGELARLAAMGVVVHLADESLADGDSGLAPYLGAELFRLMTGDVRNLDLDGRETLSVRMRREALRTHSLASRVRQVAECAALPNPPRLPLVSILLAARRPQLLEQALAVVRRQTYPRLELVLGLHGEGFGEVASDAAGPSVPVTALRLDAALSLGSVLNALTEGVRGTLLTKMDDDDLYGPDHIWDLVLAHEYSQAPLVGKAAEFVYLAGSDRTIRRFSGGGERFGKTIAGGAMLIEHHLLDYIGNWKRVRRHVDKVLIHHALRAGARIYRTHPHGLILIRHNRGHTWEVEDAYFLAEADVSKSGFRPDLAAISEAGLPYSMLGR